MSDHVSKGSVDAPAPASNPGLDAPDISSQSRGVRRAFGRIGAGLEPARKMMLDAAVLAIVAVIGVAVYKLATKTSFVVKDISVPTGLHDRGITGNVIAQLILDHIAEIDSSAGSNKQKAEISGLDFQSTMPSINLPVGGLNLTALVSEVRQALGYTETTITGEVFVDDSAREKDSPPKYGLRLRIAGQGPIYKSEHPESDVLTLISTAAERIMYKFDPINLGYYYYRKKDFEKADETADAALAGDATENYPWAYTMHGLIARDQGKFAEAATNFHRVLELDPNFGMGYVNLSGILRLDGKLDAAETAARKAVSLMPGQPDGYAALAVTLMDEGRRDEALAVMKKGVEVNPKDAQGHLALGRLQHQLEQYEAAIDSFKTSAKLASSATPLIHAADSSIKLKRRDDAYAFLRRATDADPKNADAWMAYGAAALQEHDLRKAERAFEKAAALAPNASAPLVQLAAIFFSEKRLTAADAIFGKHARNLGHDPDFLVAWSHLLLEEGKKAEATAKLLEAEAVARSNPVALQKVARDLESRGEISEAITAYEKVIAVDPKTTDVLKPYIEKLAARMSEHTGSVAAASASSPSPAVGQYNPAPQARPKLPR